MKRRSGIRPREEAAELIECYIHTQRLAPHDKLPGERAMCEMWNVNRSTLRAALRRLTQEGLLYSVLGSGTFVAPPRIERDLQDARSLTEMVKNGGHILWNRVLDLDLIQAGDHVARRLGCDPEHPVFYLRRLRIIDSTPFTIETCYLDYEICRGIEARDFRNESLYHALREYGVYPTHGKESIGITYATEEEGELLGLGENVPLFYLAGTSLDDQGKTIEYFKSVVRPDKARFSSILRRGANHSDGSDTK